MISTRTLDELVRTTMRNRARRIYRPEAHATIMGSLRTQMPFATGNAAIEAVAKAVMAEEIDPNCYPPLDSWAAGWEWANA